MVGFDAESRDLVAPGTDVAKSAGRRHSHTETAGLREKRRPIEGSERAGGGVDFVSRYVPTGTVIFVSDVDKLARGINCDRSGTLTRCER